MRKLLVATNNPHKLQEFKTLLRFPGIECVSPAAAGVPAEFDVAETGATFAENAFLKAVGFSQQTALPALADDSGLMVEALDGLPGVNSKRWLTGSDQDRNQYLLAQLKKLKLTSQRKARFITVLALHYLEKNQTYFFEGLVSGTIAEEERGTAGFGYDSVFIPEGHSRTFAELGDELKSQLSHRARAVEKVNAFLMTYKE